MKKFLSSFCYMKNGFSLMEMMIVLLVISIIAAAAAPMIAKKSARSAAGANGAIGYFGIGNNFGNQDNDASIIFGTNGLPANANNAKLYLSSRGNNNPHIALGRGNIVLGILGINNNNGLTLGNRNANTGQSAVTLGNGANASGQNAIAIGNATASQTNSVAIGNAAAGNTNAIAIGNGATSSQTNTIAIGNAAARNTNAIAIGNATASQANSVAIGNNSQTSFANSVSITTGTSNSAFNTKQNQIILGDANTEVIIPGTLIPSHFNFPLGANNTITLGNANTTVILPGDLVVNGNTLLGGKTDSHTLIREDSGDGNENFLYIENIHSWGWTSGVTTKNGDTYNSSITSGHSDYRTPINFSDRRLKNVGKPFTGGLEELKKLDLYNFTFKYDNNKTPQVGVMAQDLQKVFPNAVWEGTDKYLKIRWDEMFYAVINAVKELDAKITTIAEQVKSNVDLIKNMQAQIDEQKQEIQVLKTKNEAFEKQNKEILKRLAKLEKN